MHTQTTFELLVRASYEETAALFGPEGERVWAGPEWNPRFLHPQPARDVEGAVFTVDYGPLTALWVIARHDLEARHFQYVYFIEKVMVTTVNVQFEPVESALTRVKVEYARTAINPEAEAQIAKMTEGDRRAGTEWQEAIDTYLSRSEIAQEQS